MTAGAATLGIFGGLLLGWYGAFWWIAEHDEMSAKARHDNTMRTMWKYRRLLIVVAVIVFVLADLWTRGNGR